MNRRGFLGSILALGAAPAIVRSESLMRLFVPTESGLLLSRNNQLLSIDMITREALRMLQKNLAFVDGISNQYDADFVKSGSVLTIRKPMRFAASQYRIATA